MSWGDNYTGPIPSTSNQVSTNERWFGSPWKKL
jgi:hypothetical protein